MEDRSPRAKAPIYNWRVPSDIITGSTNNPGRHLLSNYLSGRELEAGEDILWALSEAYVAGQEGLYWKKLVEKVESRGSAKSTARNAIRKLERQRVVVGGNKSLAHGRVTMWRLSWPAFAGAHREMAKMAEKLQRKLDKKREEE
jgi:hypothetical protein